MGDASVSPIFGPDKVRQDRFAALDGILQYLFDFPGNPELDPQRNRIGELATSRLIPDELKDEYLETHRSYPNDPDERAILRNAVLFAREHLEANKNEGADPYLRGLLEDLDKIDT